MPTSSSVTLVSSPPFVGRKHEKETLAKAIDDAAQGHGSCWVIQGAEGVGKTRLALWALEHAQERGFVALRGAGTRDGLAPFYALEELFKDVPGAPPRDEKLPPTSRMMGYLDRLQPFTRVAPVIAFLDDLRWSDISSLRAFQFLVRNGRELPILWIACVRTTRADPRLPEPGQHGPGVLVEVLETMERDGLLTPLRIRGLSEHEVETLVHDSVHPPLDVTAGDPGFHRFLGLTDGNPRFVLSSVRLLHDQGRLSHGGEGSVVLPPSAASLDGRSVGPRGLPDLPETLRRAVERRLDLLGPEEQKFLAAAAIAGREFYLPPLQKVLEEPADRLLKLARRLEALLGTLHPVVGDPDRWTFSDSTAWELALARVKPEDRKNYARVLGDWWAHHRPTEVENVSRLYRLAEEPQRALPWFARGIQQALEAENAEAAERYVQWVRELTPPGAPGAASRGLEDIRVARALRQFGANAAGLRILRSIGSDLPTMTRRERDLAVIDALSETDLTEAWTSLRRLEEEVKAAPPDEVPEMFWARMLGSKAYLLRNEGALSEGVHEAVEALLHAPPDGDPHERARYLFEAGWCSLELERWDDARRFFEETLAVARENELPRHEVSALNGLGGLCFLQGDLPGALEHMEKAADIQRQKGEFQRLIPVLLNISEISLCRGDVDRGWWSLEECIRLAERFDYPRWKVRAWAMQGDFLCRERKWPQARRSYQKAIEGGKALGDKMGVFQAELGISWANAELGDPRSGSTTLDLLEKAEMGVPAQNADFFLEVRARLLELGGDPEAAREILEKARGRKEKSPHRRARIVGDISSFEARHGDVRKALLLREEADALYRESSVDPELARSVNEVFPIPPDLIAPLPVEEGGDAETAEGTGDGGGAATESSPTSSPPETAPTSAPRSVPSETAAPAASTRAPAAKKPRKRKWGRSK